MSEVSQLDLTLPDDVPFGFIAIPQYATERILRDELAMRGITVERGVRLAGFEQDADGVTATLAGARRRARRCGPAYLIGADGAHSAVRKGLGLTFEGAAFEEQYMLGDVEVDWSMPRGLRHPRRCTRPTARPTTCWCASRCPVAAATGCRCSFPTTSLAPARQTGSRTASRATASPNCTTSRRCSTGCRPSRRPHATCGGRRCSGSATASSTPTGAAGCSSRATPPTSTRRPARRA